MDTASIKIRKTAIGREKHSKMTSVAPWSNQTLLVEPDHYLVEPDPVLYPTLAGGVSSLPQRRRLQSPAAPPSPATHAAVSSLPQRRRLQPTTLSSPAAHTAVSSPQSACHGCMKMASPAKSKRLRPSIDSPSKGVNLSWVPEGYALLSSSTFRSGVG